MASGHLRLAVRWSSSTWLAEQTQVHDFPDASCQLMQGKG